MDVTIAGELGFFDDTGTESGSATPLERRIWEDVVLTTPLGEATLLIMVE
jgi:hypothetical protein